MGNKSNKPINPGAALDRVVSQANSDDCVLYRLVDYKLGKLKITKNVLL